MKDGIFLMQMGARIKAIRKAKNISLDKLCEDNAFDRSNLSRLESGKINPKTLTLKMLADKLGVDVKDFL